MGGVAVSSRTLGRSATLWCALIFLTSAVWGQRGGGAPTNTGPANIASVENNPAFNLEISVRDQHGNAIDSEAIVHLTSPLVNFDTIATTQGSTGAQFNNLSPGEYTVVVDCPGYHKVTENISLVFGHASLPVFIYLIPESMATGTEALLPLTF